MLFPRVPSSLYTPFLFLSSLDSDSIKRCVGQVNLDVWGLTRFSRKTPQKSDNLQNLKKNQKITKHKKFFFPSGTPFPATLPSTLLTRALVFLFLHAPLASVSLHLLEKVCCRGFSPTAHSSHVPVDKKNRYVVPRRRLATTNLYPPLPSSFSIAFLPGM